MEKRKIRFVDPARLYGMIKEELDAAYFEVMSKGDLIDRQQLKSFEENLAKAEHHLARFGEQGVLNQIGGDAVPAADGTTFETISPVARSRPRSQPRSTSASQFERR